MGKNHRIDSSKTHKIAGRDGFVQVDGDYSWLFILTWHHVLWMKTIRSSLEAAGLIPCACWWFLAGEIPWNPTNSHRFPPIPVPQVPWKIPLMPTKSHWCPLNLTESLIPLYAMNFFLVRLIQIKSLYIIRIYCINSSSILWNLRRSYWILFNTKKVDWILRTPSRF